MSKKIILLNGPSSAGKSTLAGVLQKLIKDRKNEDYGITSIDDFLKMSTGEVIYEDYVFDVSSEICENAIEILDSQHGVIIDHAITSERIFKQLIEALRIYDIYLIHVTCPLLELKRREKERNNRCLGSAEASYRYLFPKEGYDLTVDTLQLSVEDSALQIIDILN